MISKISRKFLFLVLVLFSFNASFTSKSSGSLQKTVVKLCQSPLNVIAGSVLYASVIKNLPHGLKNFFGYDKSDNEKISKLLTWLYVYTAPIFSTILFLNSSKLTANPTVDWSLRFGAVTASILSLVLQKAGYGMLTAETPWTGHFLDAAKVFTLLSSIPEWVTKSVVDTVIQFTRYKNNLDGSSPSDWKSSLTYATIGWFGEGLFAPFTWSYKNFFYPLFTGEEFPQDSIMGYYPSEAMYTSGQKIARDTIAKILVGFFAASLCTFDFSQKSIYLFPKLAPILAGLMFSVLKLPPARAQLYSTF